LSITRASLRASNSQRSNRYFLAEEGEVGSSSGSKATDSSKSWESDFDSSNDDEEAGDYIM
jgi:hypothetical protein